MNRTEFLDELNRRLKLVPKEDREDALAYYDEYISDCGPDEYADVEPLVGTPKEVAEKIIADCKVKHATEQREKKTVRGTASTLWLIILGIASLPVSLPLVITAVVLALVLVLVVVVILIAFAVTGLATAIGGILTIAAIFLSVSVSTIGQILIMLGLGLVGISLGLLIIIGTARLTNAVCRIIPSIAMSGRK